MVTLFGAVVPPTGTSTRRRLYPPGSKSGYLVKRGANVKTWKTRWFVWEQGTLKLPYYENKAAFEAGKKPKGTIPLDAIQAVTAPEPSTVESWETSPMLIKTPTRVWQIKRHICDESCTGECDNLSTDGDLRHWLSLFQHFSDINVDTNAEAKPQPRP